MNIPETLKVGGLVYKVSYVDMLKGSEGSFSGLARHSQARIDLAQTHDEAGDYDIQKIEECFLHEVIHCIDSVYNNQGLDESTVGRLSQGMYQVFKDNKIF